MKTQPQLKDISNAVILAAVRDFHARLRRGENDAPTPEVALADRWPSKLILAKMQKLVDAGILEYGVSLRTAWVAADNR